MERTYTDEQLATIDNPPFEYEGKVYDQYAASQKQREIERTIRKLKREQSAFEAAGLSDDARDVKARIRRLNAKYKEFSEAADLPMQRERLKVLYTDSAPKPVATLPKSAIIKPKEIRSGGGTVQTIGRIDVEKYKVVTNKIRTDEVIITDERIQHIKDHHPKDYERYVSCMVDMIGNPQYILEDPAFATAVVLKEYADEEERFRMILRLATPEDNPEYKNSVITFMKISGRNFKKYLRNKKILYKAE